jgi:hypothetical protein
MDCPAAPVVQGADQPAPDTTCPACGDLMPEVCGGPSGRHQPITRPAPDTTTGDALREARSRAERIVANWRVNFDADDDAPLINMIEANLAQLLADAADGREAAAKVQRVEKVLAFYDRHEYATANVDDFRRALNGEA